MLTQIRNAEWQVKDWEIRYNEKRKFPKTQEQIDLEIKESMLRIIPLFSDGVFNTITQEFIKTK